MVRLLCTVRLYIKFISQIDKSSISVFFYYTYCLLIIFVVYPIECTDVSPGKHGASGVTSSSLQPLQIDPHAVCKVIFSNYGLGLYREKLTCHILFKAQVKNK